jgi:hypothetical protein
MMTPAAEPARTRPRWRCALTLAAASLAVGGCQSFMPKSETHSSKADWEHSYFVNHRAPYAKLEVEIDVVQGTAPSSRELRELQAFLNRFCDKPGGITLRISDIIPRSVAATRGGDSLALEYCGGPSDAQTAYLYLIYYDSRLRGPDVTVDKPSFSSHFPTIYIDRGYRLSGNPYAGTFARAILLHEAGHALGLCATTNHHGAEGHCTNDACLMAPALNFSVRRFLTLRNPWTNRALCPDCVAELERNKTIAPAHTQHYRDGYLIRNETGYHILTAPALLYVHFGDASGLPDEELVTWRNKSAGQLARGEIGFAAATNTFQLDGNLDALARFAGEKDHQVHDLAQHLLEDIAGKVEKLAADDAELARTVLSDDFIRTMENFPDLHNKLTQLRSRLAPAATDSKNTND